jgi:hypothetical protein
MSDKSLESTYNHLEPGHPHNTKSYRVCGAVTHNELTKHEFCQLKAGWKTYHPGMGRCKLHGGSVPMDGRYTSTLARGRLKRYIEERFELANDDPLDLTQELMAQQTVLTFLLDRLGGLDPKLPQDSDSSGMAALRSYMAKSSGTYGKSNKKLEDSKDTAVSGGDVNSVIDGYLMDDPLAKFSTSDAGNSIAPDGTVSIDSELLEQIRGVWGDITTTITRVVAMRNSTAITKAEITFLLMQMKEVMGKYVDKDKQEAFVRELMERVPHSKKIDESIESE